MKRPPLAGLDQKRTAWQQAIDAWYGCNRSPKYAAEYLGLNHNTMHNRIKTAQTRGYKPRTQLGEYLRGGTPEPQQAPINKAPVIDAEPLYKPRLVVTAAMQSNANKSVLVISDLHAPYQHPDALRFLAALKEKYQPDRVISIGDEVDMHALSYHDSDPDLASAGHELQNAREVMSELEAMFPRLDILDSNHGSLLYRKAVTHGIPRLLVVEYRDALFAVRDKDKNVYRPPGKGDGWNWHDTLTIDLPTGNRCTFAHGRSKSTRRNVETSGTCYVQGHHHTVAEIVYHSTPDFLNWGMSVGCLIDNHSPAFRYNAGSIARPVISCGIIIDGQPKLLPMALAKGGRWTRLVP